MGSLERLAAFADSGGLTRTRGGLNIGLVMTRRAIENGLPIDAEQHIAPSGAQVRGLNGKAGNKILREYGVTRSIGTEVGRTNRYSVDQMRRYVAFLNQQHEAGEPDLKAFERYWVEQFIRRFASSPFKLKREPGVTVQQIVRDLIVQAETRQADTGGAMVVGAVLQHLVGAKIEVAMGNRVTIVHHSASTSDARGRGGDFDIGDAVIHVSAAPGELLVSKCRDNVEAALRPIIVTTESEVGVAIKLLSRHQLNSRVEVFGVEQFIALNANELGLFQSSKASAALRTIIDRYNEIVDANEVDPSLAIEW